MTKTAPSPRRGRKVDQVLDGARQVFMAQGFETASVDEIARVAGVSKATLYSYFPDKAQLFLEVVRSECNRQAETAMAEIPRDAPPDQVLEQVARHIVGFVLSDFAQAVFRVCMTEADRFPELARAFYDSGPRTGHDRIAEYLTEAVAAGKLRIDDIPLAADQFGELCKARLWVRAVFGIQTKFTRAEVDRVIRGAVDMFMARYGV